MLGPVICTPLLDGMSIQFQFTSGKHWIYIFKLSKQKYMYYRDPCNLPRWVLDSPFSVGTLQGFQILRFLQLCHCGTHQKFQKCLLDWDIIKLKLLQVSLNVSIFITYMTCEQLLSPKQMLTAWLEINKNNMIKKCTCLLE